MNLLKCEYIYGNTAMDFGKKLKKMRADRGLYQRDIARFLNLRGNSYIAGVELNNQSAPVYSKLKKILDYFATIKRVPEYEVLDVLEMAAQGGLAPILNPYLGNVTSESIVFIEVYRKDGPRRSEDDRELMDAIKEYRKKCMQSGDLNPELIAIVDELADLPIEKYDSVLRIIKDLKN
tara:strand:+ start:6601 stop:7134 length:534 start_codon:yes stop_codon:yes gene_type:complete